MVRERNTLADGVFHAATWWFVVVGLGLWLRAWQNGRLTGGLRRELGLALAGWGLFNLVEGIVSHHVLTLHHVRDDVADPLWWDLGLLALGAVLVVVGAALARRPDRAAPP